MISLINQEVTEKFKLNKDKITVEILGEDEDYDIVYKITVVDLLRKKSITFTYGSNYKHFLHNLNFNLLRTLSNMGIEHLKKNINDESLNRIILKQYTGKGFNNETENN